MRSSDRQEVGDAINYKMRISVLLLLCCQNAGHALLTRYSQGVLKESYSSSEVVLVGEVLKLFVSGFLVLYESSDNDFFKDSGGYRRLLWLIWNARKVIVLVILYSMSNLLAYYALTRVDASAYTVLLQLKIFTTAGFSVIFLNKNISSTKWRALLLLVIGCVLVASPAYNIINNCEIMDLKSSKALKHKQNTTELTLGICAILCMNVISGFTSIYFEGMLKTTTEKLTIWERNFQLAFYSAVLFIAIITMSMERPVVTVEFFKGWTINTVLIVIVQSSGGLLVAATLKYADSILKTLATSGSIVLSAFLGFLLLDGYLDVFVSIGCVATILAIFNYSFDATPEK